MSKGLLKKETEWSSWSDYWRRIPLSEARYLSSLWGILRPNPLAPLLWIAVAFFRSLLKILKAIQSGSWLRLVDEKVLY
ncbi:MAG: hypothetical protein JNJ65_02775 [Cyclobacteriaceae bacterium]|nr:hypothetical protein [Cyclobacteriaceae bacterium]